MERTESVQRKNILHPASLELLVNATWDFAHKLLWENWPFSQEEIIMAKNAIKKHYTDLPASRLAANPQNHFISFCERILLTKDYLLAKSHRYITHPCVWWHPLNSSGFARTQKWYIQLSDQRKALLRARGRQTVYCNCPTTWCNRYNLVRKIERRWS